MRIERLSSDPEWLLSTSGRGQPLATLRQLNGVYFVHYSDRPDEPLVFRRFIDALAAVTPRTKRQRADRSVYVRGALTRRRIWE